MMEAEVIEKLEGTDTTLAASDTTYPMSGTGSLK
jgi:hypothetical protein